MNKYDRGTGHGKVFSHPRTMVKPTNAKMRPNPDCVEKDIWGAIDILKNQIEELERKDKHNNRVIEALNRKVSFLSRRHQRTRDIACEIRNKVSPISEEERNEIRQLIEAKAKERQFKINWKKSQQLAHEIISEMVEDEKAEKELINVK